MHQQTWQIQQQLQRVQQICTETVQINQQAVQQLQQIQQQVGQISNLGTLPTQNIGTFQTQGGYYGGFSSPALNAVMQADRQATMQQNTPSYRNYNTQIPQYSPSQSVNYTSGTSFGAAPLQTVMAADHQASVSGTQSPYSAATQFSSAGAYGSTWM